MAERHPFGEPDPAARDEQATDDPAGAAAPEPSLVARQLGAAADRDLGELDVDVPSTDRVDAAAATFGSAGPAAAGTGVEPAAGDEGDLTGSDVGAQGPRERR